MKPLKKLLVFFEIVLVLLLLVGGGGLWWLNQTVTSPRFRQEIEAGISKAFGAPATIGKLTFQLTHGITLENITITNSQDSRQPDLITVRRIELDYELIPLLKSLLQQKPEFTRLLIVEPAFALRQKEDGTFPLPPIGSASAAGGAGSKGDGSLPLALRSFSLQEGSVLIKDAASNIKLNLEGIQTDGALSDASTGGVMKIDHVSLAQNISLSALQTPFTVVNEKLVLSGLEATAYQGRLAGSAEQSLTGPEYAYNLKLNGDNLDVNTLLTECGGRPQVMSGKLNVKSAWLGPATDFLKITGTGSVEIKNGQLIAVPLLRTVAGLFGLKQLEQPDFSEVKTDFTVADQTVKLTGLSVRSVLFDLTGEGTVGFDQQLNLQLKLGLSPDLCKQMPAGIPDRLTARDDGFRTVTFAVTGTASEPKTDLPQKLLLGDQPLSPETIRQDTEALKSLKKNLKELFGPKKTTDPAPTPAPPVPSPSPDNTGAPAPGSPSSSP